MHDFCITKSLLAFRNDLMSFHAWRKNRAVQGQIRDHKKTRGDGGGAVCLNGALYAGDGRE